MFETGNIDGVLVRDLVRYTDKRGWLTELYRSDEAVASPLLAMAYMSAAQPRAKQGPYEHRIQANYNSQKRCGEGKLTPRKTHNRTSKIRNRQLP